MHAIEIIQRPEDKCPVVFSFAETIAFVRPTGPHSRRQSLRHQAALHQVKCTTF